MSVHTNPIPGLKKPGLEKTSGLICISGPCRNSAAQNSGAKCERMPVGGWLSEIATNENWRTTTIVRRHRDQAASQHQV